MSTVASFSTAAASKSFYTNMVQDGFTMKAIMRGRPVTVLYPGDFVRIATGLYLDSTNYPFYLIPVELPVGIILETPMLKIIPDRQKEITVVLRNIRSQAERPVEITHGQEIARLFSPIPIGCITVDSHLTE